MWAHINGRKVFYHFYELYASRDSFWVRCHRPTESAVWSTCVRGLSYSVHDFFYWLGYVYILWNDTVWKVGTNTPNNIGTKRGGSAVFLEKSMSSNTAVYEKNACSASNLGTLHTCQQQWVIIRILSRKDIFALSALNHMRQWVTFKDCISLETPEVLKACYMYEFSHVPRVIRRFTAYILYSIIDLWNY